MPYRGTDHIRGSRDTFGLNMVFNDDHTETDNN